MTYPCDGCEFCDNDCALCGGVWTDGAFQSRATGQRVYLHTDCATKLIGILAAFAPSSDGWEVSILSRDPEFLEAVSVAAEGSAAIFAAERILRGET